MKKLTVVLRSVGNPDRGQDPNRPVYGVPTRRVKVASIREASDSCRAYIEEHLLGGGNWKGGQVYDGDRQVAWISYNGRAWNPEDLDVEIPL